MGCRQSKTELFSALEECVIINNHSSHDLSDDHFSQHQKDLLRSTWKLIDTETHGVAIFQRIFQKNPSAQQHFPFRDARGVELLQNSYFRMHARRFTRAIGSTIDSLDALEVSLIPVLHRLGEVHGWIPGFEEKDLPIFMDSILETLFEQLGDDVCTAEVRQTWIHLAAFMSDTLVVGYKKIKNKEGNDKDNDKKQNMYLTVEGENHNGITVDAVNLAEKEDTREEKG